MEVRTLLDKLTPEAELKLAEFSELASIAEYGVSTLVELLEDPELTLTDRRILEGAIIALLRIRWELAFECTKILPQLKELKRMHLKHAARESDQSLLTIIAETTFEFLTQQRQEVLELAREVVNKAYKRLRRDSDPRDEYDQTFDEIEAELAKFYGGDPQ